MYLKDYCLMIIKFSENRYFYKLNNVTQIKI